MGEMRTNCYLLWQETGREAVIIDPADDGVSLAQEINQMGLRPKMILLTHGHFDHCMGALDLKLIFDIPVAANSKDLFLLKRIAETASYFLKRKVEVPPIKKIDLVLDEKSVVKIGKTKLRIIETPGHTPGGVCFYEKDSESLFSGDTLFFGTIGRTDLSYSSKLDMAESLKKLWKLPKTTMVHPGHGKDTTIGQEIVRS